MRRQTLATGLVLGLVTAGVLGSQAPATAGHHGDEPTGTRSLVDVLLADGDQFDRNRADFDILTEAVKAVLAGKPDSPVAVLADGSVPLTAFLPDDFAFKALVADLTGRWYRSEQATFNAVAALGLDTVETVLLYHVIPGATIDSRTAFDSDGAVLTTAQGGTVTVDVVSAWWCRFIRLVDQDPNDVDPVLDPRALDINKGNLQIAHGMFLVLRPLDL